jgi:hypothetical protein
MDNSMRSVLHYIVNASALTSLKPSAADKPAHTRRAAASPQRWQKRAPERPGAAKIQ